MTKEPDNLILKLLRGMRADMASMQQEMKGARNDLREIRRILDDHALRFDFLEERVATLREATKIAIRFSHAEAAP